IAGGVGGFRDEPASGVGVATYDVQDRLLDAWFPSPRLGSASTDEPCQLLPTGTDPIRDVHTETVRVSIASLAEPPVDTADVWLRLHLLSHRLIRPHEANLDGIFGLLTNVAWTSAGPVLATELQARSARLRSAHGHVTVLGVDKFPRMVDYVV